ncbi:stage II sporulation protein P [Asaccharospora irregularis]|uniref:Stage II sporulation protein P n=1 Tax=Asaccharospora irregularis DSM 2635 TaxID=1121321 RepID=A0A1M5M4K2_9FIRM|nr:stage II sporulation protein P [Asaccharospora irregularis]SHG72170.1 stage II sporulation protein P [Asaccharospora irregularis DSM 2635]
MLKKYISIVTIVCMLVCILPSKSYSMDKDNFIKFLINSSYPEVDNDKKDNNQDNDKDPNKNKDANENTEVLKSNKNEKNKNEYIKVHVGEENIPNIASNYSVEQSKSEYKDDIRVTREKPRLLIYHTHGCETYSNSPEGNYHSRDKKNSVMEVGRLLTDQLTNKGWGVIHTTKYHDYPSYNNSYASSLKTIQNIVSQNNSIDIAIDLHRDARDVSDPKIKEIDHKKYTTTINGERVAKFFLVVGGKNENADQIRKLAHDITKFGQKKYPGLVCEVIEKDYAKFNQFVAKNHMLIEVGNNATSIEESKATTKYIAEILDEYFMQNE